MTNEKAINQLKDMQSRCKNGYDAEAINLAIKALEDARPTGEWIPVSERLPEEKINPRTNDFESVLCTTIWGDVRAYKFGKPIGHDKQHFWLDGGIMDKYITAWQPFPQPYKKGEEE